MATGVLGTSARVYHTAQTHYLSAVLNFNQVGNLSIGFLPANASVLRSRVHVKTAFNAGTTNTISAGPSGALTAFANALAGGAVALLDGVITAAQAGPVADIEVFASYAQTGAVATAGQALVTIEYMVPL
jgi:hypothetical protein